MRRIFSGACLLLLLAAAGVVQAGEKSDPAAMAKAIAPFIDKGTVAIVHADMSRLDLAFVHARSGVTTREQERAICGSGATLAVVSRLAELVPLLTESAS